MANIIFLMPIQGRAQLKKLSLCILSVSLISFSATLKAQSLHYKVIQKIPHSQAAKNITPSTPKPEVLRLSRNSEIASVVTAPIIPEFPLSGSMTATSNYLFRGITQTRNLPAFQGGLTYNFRPIGFYLNLWGSNVYKPINSTHTSTLEVNSVAGITNTFKENFHYDLHIVHYDYPKDTSLNFNEVIGSLTYRFITGLIAYSNDVFGSGSSGEYYNLGVFHEIPAKYVYFDNVGIGAYFGHSSLPKAAGKSYNDYSVYLSKKIKIYNFTLQWSDTDRNLPHNLDGSKLLGNITVIF